MENVVIGNDARRNIIGVISEYLADDGIPEYRGPHSCTAVVVSTSISADSSLFLIRYNANSIQKKLERKRYGIPSVLHIEKR